MSLNNSVPPSFSSFPELPSNSPPAPKRKEKGKERHPKREKKSPAIPADAKDKHRKDPHVDTESSHSRLFYSDRRGDPLNISFGGLNSRDVPKYHSSRSILGLSPSLSALYRTSQGIEVGPPGRRKMPSLTDASSRTLLSREPTRSLVNPSSSRYKYEEYDGFLRLPSHAARDQSYRSIENTNANSDSESDSAVSDAGSSSEEDVLNSHQAMLKSINDKLAVEPSVSNWLSLLSYTLSTIPTTSKNATRARSEILISILSRALASNGNSHILKLKYLKAGEEVWHESKLRAEWEDVLRSIGGVEIWMEWFEWRIRKGNKGIAVVVDDAKRALAALHHDDVGQVRIFWRLAVAFQNAGFGERATGMFQAQAELTFQIPQALYGLPLSQRLDSLEEFWESECPRLGEAGAKGWASWVSSGRPSTVPPSRLKPSPGEDLDPYRKYSFSESLADRVLFLPSRSTDFDSESDPYATILFSDIKDLLLGLESRRARDVFRYACLTVFGLNLPGFRAAPLADDFEPSIAMNFDDRWSYTHLVRPVYLDAILPPTGRTPTRIVNDSVAGVLIGREREYASGLGGPVLSWRWGVLGPLEVPSSNGRTRGLWGKEDLEGVDVPFVRALFSQLRLGADDVEWDLLALAFEAASNVKSALKLSRGFLSTARDSLFHWAAHAQLEQLRGRPDDARKVYETVLVTSAPLANRPGTGQLWWNWAEMEWLAGKPEDALKVILRSAGVEGTGSAVLLRAKRNLDDTLNATDKGNPREPWIKLRALMELLTSGPAQALQIFDTHLLALRSGSVQHESLTVAALLKLYRHAIVLMNPTPPALLRGRVEEMIELYPSNSVLLGLFLEAEKGQGVWGKVRSILGESGGVEKDVLRRVEEVWIAGWDKGRWEAEIERTRSGLAAAVESERTRGSPIIWRIFIEFEIRAGELQRAKRMLFRAIDECPLVKELYLVAFGPLRAVFSAHELNGFADTMAERELRLRRGLDEFLEGWEEKEEHNDEDEDSGDEIESAAKEYRHRLPY
ncbi:NRDE-2, necessary for RNA interference-domain-containing protein [Mycena sp. CBHHK59/15]|nr:NRDE-2, necessary for RNA interference-domain-containing protein [Mycena sp. CBHHK59/15]